MDFPASPIRDIRGIRLEGELDIATMERLSGLLDEAIEAGGPILLDLTPLRFIDSTGINAIVRAMRALEKGGWCIYLHIDDGEVGRVLDLTGLAQVPNVHVIDHRGAHTPEPVG